MKKEFVRVSHPGENFNIRTITIDATQTSYLIKTHFHDNIEIIMASQGEILCNVEGTSISLTEGNVSL